MWRLSSRRTIAVTRPRVSHGGRGRRPAKNMLYSASSRFSSPSSTASSRSTPIEISGTRRYSDIAMTKSRLEAFSDGVIAILITIMVLELRVPHGTDWTALEPLLPVLLTYLLSFVFLGIYWNNHHHLLHATTRISGGVLWANLHLLSWL